MILSCSNLEKSFSEQLILTNCSFHIEDYDKTAIVGINGSGKTTLIKMLVGDIQPDNGIITFTKDKTFGYLSQHQTVTSGNSIYDELLSVKKNLLDLEASIRTTELDMKHVTGEELELLMNIYSNLTHQFEFLGGYGYKSEVVGVLKGLGFSEEDFSKLIDTLSGGQKTRIALGKLLLQKPDLIILDEPTNHLDMASISWLETYLLNYKGAVIIVSHDRYFLDKITNNIIEIDHGFVTTFTGNYSAYAAKKEMLRVALWHAYMNQQKEIKHQEEVIEKLKSFNREKSIKRAESREKMLAKVDVLGKPLENTAQIKMKIEPKILSGNDVLTLENLSKSFDHLTLFTNLNLTIKRGEHIALIGNNGTGKTTILKIINELVEPDTGTIELGSKVKIGYYDQEHHVLHMEKNLIEEIADDYPKLTTTEIRNTLAAFLFTGDAVFKRISDLSGGERGRVSLAKLMLSAANFLILDEPTNHLDINSKEILENVINHYSGTVLVISHDRYFVNKIATRIIDLTNDGLLSYIGNYDYYQEKKSEIIASAIDETGSSVTNDSENALDWKQKKEAQAKQRKLESLLKTVEDSIEILEQRIDEINELMSTPLVCSNVARLQVLGKEQEDASQRLVRLYEQWEALSV